ncbi:MAG: hypothetical protein SFU87_09545 [Chitinophagaceae bacterium]|nr:hypothetical protein [Chitinophagaceae bacterium]
MPTNTALRTSMGLLCLTLFFSSCFKDKCLRTYTYFEPVYKTSAEVRVNVKSNAPQPVERPGKLFIKGNYIFLNDIDKGVHIIDNSNPSSPKNVAFISIPGNMDLAVKGDMLYADMYMDLVAIDIVNPLNAVARKFIDDAFPFRRYSSGFLQDTGKIIVDWKRIDTTVELECGNGGFFGINPEKNFVVFDLMSQGAANSTGGFLRSPFGMGGSMARFTIVNNQLYTVSDYDLNVFSISTAENPVFSNKVNIGFGIETIYPFGNRLFIGSTDGMYIYDISNASNPSQVGKFGHVRSCDPVIADNDHAYVTLRSGTECQGFTNQLEVLSLQSITNPSLLKTYSMTNPHGLSKDGSLLFVCDGKDGLKIYDATQPRALVLLKHIANLEAYDVIAWNNIALLSAKDGLYQYEYSNAKDIKLLSKIDVNN